MKDVESRLAKRGIALAVTDAALDFVLAESYDPVSIPCAVSLKTIFLNTYIFITFELTSC